MISNNWWKGSRKNNLKDTETLKKHLFDIEKPLFITEINNEKFISDDGSVIFSQNCPEDCSKLIAMAEPVPLKKLGAVDFCEEYGIDFPYIGGSMAYGISSVEMVEEFAKNGMLAFLGTGGMSPEQAEKAVKRLNNDLKGLPYGCNLIHMPSMDETEMALINMYLRENVKIIEASAFVTMTPALIKYRVKGIHKNDRGEIETPNKVIAKASRTEVATKFLSPPPENILRDLLDKGEITAEEAELAKSIPVAWDITAEADSGGHTDNRPAMALMSSFLSVRDRLQKQYSRRIRVGFGGGIGTPHAAAAAFAMGAAYIVTGTVNHACIESGTSDIVREMLAEAKQADTAMAPSADLFDLGGRVQVLKSGTLFAMRAQKLMTYYNSYECLDDIPEKEREFIEKTIMRDTIDNIWNETQKFFNQRAPFQIEKALKSPKYKMALVFRYYLGLSSRWAISGNTERKIDFQIWTGPAIGSFNEWCEETFLASPKERKVALVAYNILLGAAAVTRMNSLRHYGLELFSEIEIKPQKLTKKNIAAISN